MRSLLTLLLLAASLLALNISVYWVPAVVKQTVNGIVLEKGTPTTYVMLKEPKIFFLCFKASGGDATVTAKLYADVRVGSPSLQDTYQLHLADGKERCVMVPLKPEKATEIQTNQLNKVISQISKGKLKLPKVNVVLQNFLGYYVDLYIRSGTEHAVWKRFAYLRVLPYAPHCLQVSFAPNAVVPIGSEVKVRIKNVCNYSVGYKVAVDMVDAPDVVLKSGELKAGEEITVNASVPNAVGKLSFGVTGFLVDFPNGVYVSEVGEKEVTVAFLPAYDYYAFFVGPNLRASWYQDGVLVRSVKPGSAVKGCLEVPELVPYAKVPGLSGVMEVRQDRAFLPDVTIQKTDVVISKLPFELCTTFTAKGGWGARGFKLRLVVQGLSYEAKPELKLK